MVAPSNQTPIRQPKPLAKHMETQVSKQHYLHDYVEDVNKLTYEQQMQILNEQKEIQKSQLEL